MYTISMTTTLPVNLHCHSIFSDGEFTPEALAELLAANGVRYAALTDHDTIEGQHRFQSALKKNGVNYIPAVELTTFYKGIEVHLLGYGFKVDDVELNHALLSLRQHNSQDTGSIASSLRKRSATHLHSEKISHQNSIPEGKLDTADGIRLIHQAGGCVFLAHPITLDKDHAKISRFVKQLKALGLDGIEAVYASHTKEEEQKLISLASDQQLAICAGTDLHNKNQPPAIEMRNQDWVAFRTLLFSNPGFFEKTDAKKNTFSLTSDTSSVKSEPHHLFRKRAYIMRIFLPTFIAITLFLAAIWVFVLPSFENTLLDRKREMIRELTYSALSILTSYHHDELSGTLSREQAQSLAIDRVQALRYGDDGKDYFWIQDTSPAMIMHPYRVDLNGHDLTDFKDARGVRIFVEFSTLVQQKGEGYIEYVWQWKDDPERLEPKESFVKLFAPWGWIIGTGIYIDDVHAEIDKIERNITTTSIVISALIILLLLFVLQQSLQIEKSRQETLENFKESTERYHAVIETMTEGTLLVLENRCYYANATMVNLVGYTQEQLPFLNLEDVLPRCEENKILWEAIDQVKPSQPTAVSTLDGILRHDNGHPVECILLLNSIQYANQNGFILLARRVAHQTGSGDEEGLANAANHVELGIFRAKPIRRGVFIDLNPAGVKLIPTHLKDEGKQPALADLFSDSREYDQFMQDIHNQGQIKNKLLHHSSENQDSLILALSAKLVKNDANESVFIIGTLENVTQTYNLTAEREVLIEKLQSSLLFFHEPLSKFERSLTICDLQTSLSQVAKKITDQGTSAALISADNNTIIGIITDHDLRARVLAKNIDPQQPAYAMMTSPVLKIKESAMIYEAMIKMEENSVRYLAVEDENGHIVNLVDTKMLTQFPRYGAYVLLREISQCTTLDDLIKTNQRKFEVIKTLLDSSRNVKHVTNMLSCLHDASTERLIQLAIEELGPPPAPFAWIAMGSQGRQEPTLIADQDNGIIYSAKQDFSAYFLDLGSRVCSGLDALGYKYCDGKVMANQPPWSKPLEAWKKDFNRRVNLPEPQELLELSIFFDFRLVYGDANLVQDLRKHVNLSLLNRNDFYYLFAKHTQKYKPPARGIGGILLGLTGSETGEHETNLKDALMPIVSYARLYAVKHNIPRTHTLERLDGLADRGIMLSIARDDLAASYEFVMLMRLKNQIAISETGDARENRIHSTRMSEVQQVRLREVFSQISALQKRIDYDFLGGI